MTPPSASSDPPGPRVLLINPCITDVAAYDLWAWPLGLLYWAARLRQWGFRVGLIDCLDRAHPALQGRTPRTLSFHTGKYFAERFHLQPTPARRAHRYFRRYGLPPEAFDAQLQAFETQWDGPPDLILVASRMTYWYHGVAEAIALCRHRWSAPGRRQPPIVLGGVYATLCPQHARANSGADLVIEGDGLETLPRYLRERFPSQAGRIAPTPSPDPENWPRPAIDLLHAQGALPLLTSIGCPFDCSYCASRQLAPHYFRRRPESVFRDVADWSKKWGTEDFVFYDDALLVDSERYFEPFLDHVIAAEIPARYHVPNGMHYDKIDARLAGKMRRAGFQTIRLSLESASPERLALWGRRGDNLAFRRAVVALREAGFERRQIGVYIMAGMPEQNSEEIRQAIALTRDAGAMAKLNEYSPIPGTLEWDRAVEVSGGEIAREPLWQNNSLYYTRPEAFPRQEFETLKAFARETANA